MIPFTATCIQPVRKGACSIHANFKRQDVQDDVQCRDLPEYRNLISARSAKGPAAERCRHDFEEAESLRQAVQVRDPQRHT